MKFVFAFFTFITIVWACSGAKKLAPTPVEFTRLTNYSIDQSITFPDKINYKFITGKDEFNGLFSMTKSIPGRAIVPDFTIQSVVAIVLEPSEKIITVQVDNAEITGNEMNIFYTVTDTTSWKSYRQIPKVIGTVPKNTAVEKVNFYRDNKKEKTLAVSY